MYFTGPLKGADPGVCVYVCVLYCISYFRWNSTKKIIGNKKCNTIFLFYSILTFYYFILFSEDSNGNQRFRAGQSDQKSPRQYVQCDGSAG